MWNVTCINVDSRLNYCSRAIEFHEFFLTIGRSLKSRTATALEGKTGLRYGYKSLDDVSLTFTCAMYFPSLSGGTPPLAIFFWIALRLTLWLLICVSSEKARRKKTGLICDYKSLDDVSLTFCTILTSYGIAGTPFSAEVHFRHLWKNVHYITLHDITQHYITLHYITLHYITLHYVTLQTYEVI